MEILKIKVDSPDLFQEVYYPMSIYCQIMAAIEDGHPITHFVLCNYDNALKPFPIEPLVGHCEEQIRGFGGGGALKA